MLMPLLAVCRF